jgi:predicted dehydrogenase
MSSSRREFLKQLSTTTAAAAAMLGAGSHALGESPAATATTTTAGADGSGQPLQGGKKIGYCIVGLGRISLNEFMPGVQISEHSKLVALVSGHRDKAERVADQYGIDHKAIYNYENYDQIAHNPEIDAVYIALPNGMHAEYTIRAAQAGKHVLCEKPMANTVAECEQMIAACRKADRKLMIAYRMQFEPNTLNVIQKLRQGYTGKLLELDCAFGFNIKPGEWRLNKKLAGGGPLYDVGIYCVNASRYLTGEEPVSVQGYSSVVDQDGRFTEVEENLAWNMRFPSGVVASCLTSYGSIFTGNLARIIGPTGTIEMNPAYSYSGIHVTGRTGSGVEDLSIVDPNPRQFAREADHLATCILEDKEPKADGYEGLRDMQIITAIYQSCAEGRAIPLKL